MNEIQIENSEKFNFFSLTLRIFDQFFFVSFRVCEHLTKPYRIFKLLQSGVNARQKKSLS